MMSVIIQTLRSCFKLIAITGLLVFAPTKLPVAHADASHRHALLIGVSNYSTMDHASGNSPDEYPLFPNLSCDEDLACIKAALVKAYGFDPSPAKGEMVVLNTPLHTTRSAILDAFDHLIAVTQPEDLVYIHYSGHGSRVLDATMPGGHEGALVPSDYKDDLTNLITGKELGLELARLKAKHPAQIVFSLDCMHLSTDASMWGSVQVRDSHETSPSSQHVALAPQTPSAKIESPELENAGCVILVACGNDESAYETTTATGDSVGRFSYALAQVLAQAAPRTTYWQIYDQIRAQFAQKFADQHPEVDGNPDTYLFGGAAKQKPLSILVTVVTAGHLKLDAGSLQGMTMDSEFAVYSRDATDLTPENEIAEAKITSLHLTTADLILTRKLKPGLTDDSFSAAHAVELMHNYKYSQLTFDAASVKQFVPAQAPAILDKLMSLKLVSITPIQGKTPDLALVRNGDKAHGTAELDLVRGDTGHVMQSLDESGDLSAQLYTTLQKVARYHYVVGLGQDQAVLNTHYHIALRLVPVEVKPDAYGDIVFDHDKSLPADATLHIGDYFTIEAQNTSGKSLFLTVLDLGSDFETGQVWPEPRDMTQTNLIAETDPGKWVKLWRSTDKTQPALYRATSADPHEIYKAIAMDKYVNLKALLTRGVDFGRSNPFDGLLRPTVGDGTRGTDDTALVNPGTWTVANYQFQVK